MDSNATMNKNTIDSGTLTSIFTSSENIDGMMSNLRAIMDSNGYKRLYDEYMPLKSLVPSNTVPSKEEVDYGYFGVDLKYYGLDRKFRDFEKKLKEYNRYKVLNDKINDIAESKKVLFEDSTSLDTFVILNKELLMCINECKDDKDIKQFTSLMSRAFNTLYTSLKLLCSFNDNRLLDFINSSNSDYVRENVSSLIRKDIDVSSMEGLLEEDHIDYETISSCAKNDHETTRFIKEAKEYSERIKQEKENEIRRKEESKRRLEEIKRRKMNLKLRLALIRFLALQTIILPVSCPIIGHAVGKNESNKVDLTKTITSTVDINSGRVINSKEEYCELITSYVASLTICEPYKKNISGTSYSRVCNVYDYDTTGLDINEKITNDNIDPSRLTFKYKYEESTSSIEDLRYLSDSQIYVTETYQDLNNTVKSNKYTLSGTLVGLGIGVALGAGGILLKDSDLADDISDKAQEYKRELRKLED